MSVKQKNSELEYVLLCIYSFIAELNSEWFDSESVPHSVSFSTSISFLSFSKRPKCFMYNFIMLKKKWFDLIVLQFTEKQIQLAVKQVFPFNCVLLSFQVTEERCCLESLFPDVNLNIL